MGCKILHDPDIGNSPGEWSLASRRDLVQLAEFTFSEPLSGVLKRGVVTLDVADRAYEPPRSECLCELPSPT